MNGQRDGLPTLCFRKTQEAAAAEYKVGRTEHNGEITTAS
jgi:hypothetical protein